MALTNRQLYCSFVDFLYWDEWNWGNVPAWLGTVSLILAFRIFLRDRGNAERKQIDQLGVWFDTEYTIKAPWSEHSLEPVRIVAHVRNASDAPIEVAQLAYAVHTRWCVPDDENWTMPDGVEPPPAAPGVWVVEDGIGAIAAFVEEFRVPPQDTVDSQHVVHVDNMAPKGARQLAIPNGVKASASWLLVIDNAGRRWQLCPGQAGRARRIRWYSFHSDFYPKGWGRRWVTLKELLARFR